MRRFRFLRFAPSRPPKRPLRPKRRLPRHWPGVSCRGWVPASGLSMFLPTGTGSCLKWHGGELQITGNSAVSMAFGLNCYLREYCRVTVTWYRRDKIDEPKRLPVVEGRVEREARVENRFFLNYCTYGYSLNWWQWDEWEHFIDWMALNGVTMALATTGQEAVWQRVWRQFGLDDETICRYFTGPSYLPWHRMANIDAWHGPLPQSWIDGQLELQRRIIAGNGSWASSRSSPLSRGMCQGAESAFPRCGHRAAQSVDKFRETLQQLLPEPCRAAFQPDTTGLHAGTAAAVR